MNKQEIEKLINKYETAKKQLNDLIQVQEAYKLDLNLQKIELKYSAQYDQIKTIKEKEEKATLDTQETHINLINTNRQVNDKKLECEILKLKIDLLMNAD